MASPNYQFPGFYDAGKAAWGNGWANDKPNVQGVTLNGPSSMAKGYAKTKANSWAQGLDAAGQFSGWLGGLKEGGAFGGAGGPNQSVLEKLKGDPAYQALLAKGQGGGMSMWNEMQPGVEAAFSLPMAHLKKILDSENPSGAPIVNAQQLAAKGMAPVEAGGAALARNLTSAGSSAGNRSGVGNLASVLPGQMVAQARGQVNTAASLGATESERSRAAMNSQMKMSATQTSAGLAGQKAGIISNAIQGGNALSQSALQAAQSAFLQVLSIMQSSQGQFSGSFGPNGPTMNFTMPMGA